MIHHRITRHLIVPTVLVLLAPGAAGGQAAAAASKDDGQWTMPAKDYASTRYSRLSQINAVNAKRLRALWSFSTGVLGGHEG